MFNIDFFREKKPGFLKVKEVKQAEEAVNEELMKNIRTRAFVKQMGVAVLGTVVEGELRKGQQATINGKKTKIGGLGVNFKMVSVAKQGEEVALNLPGISKEDLFPGTTIEFK